MIVAFGSGRSRLVGRSEGAFRSIEVARIVAFGSKVCGAINSPPSNVQNFCPSSGKVRLHLGQVFIRATLLIETDLTPLPQIRDAERQFARARANFCAALLLAGSSSNARW